MLPTFKIIEGNPEDADAYRRFCQPIYQHTYPRPEFGITPEMFSQEAFEHPHVIGYFEKLFEDHPAKRAWLARDEDGRILGGIAVEKTDDRCEIKGFYVDPDHQGEGIGKQLFKKVEALAGDLPIELDVVEYATDTIAIYERWGFVKQSDRGKQEYFWASWPPEALAKYQGIFMKRNPSVDKLSK